MSTSRHPLDELRALLATPAPVRGRVTRVLSGRVQIATPTGLQTVQSGGTLYVGQAVTLARGVAYPAAVASAVYSL